MAAPEPQRNDDAQRAIAFLAVKAAVFIGLPILAAAVAVMLTLK